MNNLDHASRTHASQNSLTREFLSQQLPLILGVFGLGIAAAYWQHGFLPGGTEAFPLAAVSVPIWHLVWMGFWTGYTLAVVGEAAGIFALPYTMSVLQFSTPFVTPTTQILTLLNPLGALLGFRRNGQWNRDLALWVCLGGVLGGLIGPFLRLTVLHDTEIFTFAVGIALALVSVHLCIVGAHGLIRRRHTGIEAKFAVAVAERRRTGQSPSGLPEDIGIETVSKTGARLTISFWGETWTVNVAFLFVTGALVGVVSAALGVGGGFLLVPIFSAIYGLPMYVLVAATIPYVIVLSLVGLFTYGFILPATTGMAIPPEWAWGLFTASGGILGAWCAAKTQRFVPEHWLKLMLGMITGASGVLYVINFFVELPFRL